MRRNNYSAEPSLSKTISVFIEDELCDKKLYALLAEMTNDPEDKEILYSISMAADEHSAILMQEYYRIAGRKYISKQENEKVIEDYGRALLDGIREKSKRFTRYNTEYINAPNKVIAKAFSELAVSEAEHALLLQLIYSKRAVEKFDS